MIQISWKKNQHRVFREPWQVIQTDPIAHIPFYPDTFHEKLRSRSVALMEAAGLVNRRSRRLPEKTDETEHRDSDEKQHKRSS